MAIDPHDDEAAARAMLAAAEADTSTGAERLRTAGRLFTRVLIVTLIVAPVFLSIALWRFTQALQTGNWPAFWVAIVGSAALLMLPIYLYFYDPTADRNSGLAYVYLRGSVNSGDENLAPIVSISLAPVPRLARLQYVHVIGGEYKARAAFVQAFQGCYLALLLLVVTWFGGWVSSTTPEMVTQMFVDYLPAIGITEALLIVSAFSVSFFAIGSLVGKTIHFDERGLRWRIGFLNSRWRQVSWDTIRVSGRFARLDVNRNKWEHDAHTYFLDVGDILLIWGVNPFESAAGGAYTPKEIKAEWESFAASISSRSDLPLRDITPVALAVARAIGGHVRERRVAQMLLARPRTSEPITVPGLDRAVAILAEENPRRQRLLRRLSWVPFMLFVALYVIGAIIQFGG